MLLMIPQFFEESLTIKGSGSVDIAVFGPVVICGSTTMKASKIYWVIAEIFFFFIKGMLHYVCWVNPC